MTAETPTNPSSSLEIVRLRSTADLREYEALVRNVAGYVDVTAGVMLSIIACGGLLVGVRDERRRLVGGALALLGLDDGGPFLHSEMMVVVPDRQGQGVGYRLKLAQRDYALSRGIDLIVWTFDPLRTPNANLNLHKLGGIARRYIPNMYGPLPGFSAGLATDQLFLEWHVTSGWVRRRLSHPRADSGASEATPIVTKLGTHEATTFPTLAEYDVGCSADRVFVEVPDNGGEIRRSHGDVARNWRLGLREIFQAYLARGYWVTDVVRVSGAGPPRSRYLIELPRSPGLRQLRHVSAWSSQ